jgi:NAD(P)-dependent dehydrogenase (short-subunit alcohol dehydrogenase family)
MPTTTSKPLDGRTALVTGSTSGIGAAIATTLAAAGAHVLVTGRHEDRARHMIQSIEADGGRADHLQVDLAAAPGALRAFAHQAARTLGGHVDILVLNAGVYPVGPTEALSDEDLDTLLAVNVRAPHVLVAALAPAMAAREAGGTIVVVGSWMASVGNAGSAMYTATKAADEQLARAWAAEYGPRGVRVNALAPGVTLTPGNEAYREVLDAMTAGTPAQTVIQPQHIADGVLFLASDQSAMVHGTTLYVDGGITAIRPG